MILWRKNFQGVGHLFSFVPVKLWFVKTMQPQRLYNDTNTLNNVFFERDQIITILQVDNEPLTVVIHRQTSKGQYHESL